MTKEKVLITGANGFIGSFLVEESIAQNLDVYAAVRKNSNITALEGLDVTIIEMDYTDKESISQILSEHNFEYILHNAGITKTKKLEDYLKVNKDYLVNIVESVRLSGIKLKKILFVSSLASYGPADFQKEGILNKNAIPHPVTDYGRSKLAAEEYLIAQTDIPYIILRPTAVYGPREKDLLNVFQLLNKRLEISAGLLPQKLTFIYVKDLVRLMISGLISDVSRKAYFVTDGNVYTGDALSGFIRESLGKRALKIKLPIFLLKGIAFSSEKLSGLWDSYPPLNIDKVHELKARNWSCDVSDLKKDLNFECAYDLTTGIPETVAWYKAHKWI